MLLSKSHPSLYEENCKRGSWTVQRKDLEPFSSIAGDQAIEQTVNRDSKISGGLTGMTLNRGIFYMNQRGSRWSCYHVWIIIWSMPNSYCSLVINQVYSVKKIVVIIFRCCAEMVSDSVRESSNNSRVWGYGIHEYRWMWLQRTQPKPVGVIQD